MGPGEAVSTAMSRFGRFSGRAERDEYFWYVLVTFVWSVLGRVIDLFARGAPPGVALAVELPVLLVDVTLLIPSLALSVRRLHDTDRTGRWLWLWLVPVFGPLVVFVLACRSGTDGVNRHGPPADAHHRDFRPDPSPRDRSPWVAPALAAAALGVVAVLLLAGYGAVVLARPHRTVTTAATDGTGTSGPNGPDLLPSPPVTAHPGVVATPPAAASASGRPATCPSTEPADGSHAPTATPASAPSSTAGPIAADADGVTVTPDVNGHMSSSSRPLYEISGTGSRRVRVALAGRRAYGGVDNDGPVQVWGVPAGTEPTGQPVYENDAGEGGMGDIGGTAGEWDVVVSTTSPATSWTIDLADRLQGAGSPTFAPATAQDCSDVVVSPGREPGQRTVRGHGSRHVLLDLAGRENLGGSGASSSGFVSMSLLPASGRPTDTAPTLYANGAGTGGVVFPPRSGHYGLWVQTLEESTSWELDLG